MTMLVSLLMSLSAGAYTYNDKIFQPEKQIESNLSEITSSVAPGTVVIVAEEHDNATHHVHQVEFLKRLTTNPQLKKIAVGMEFFEYPDQAKVDDYLSGELSEIEFLKQIGWSKGNPFDFYREQVLFSKSTGARTYALNLPRTISRKISQNGIASLTPEENAYLPAFFQIGNAKYRQRFIEAMGGHGVDSAKVDRYFEAQSAWDDTMASVAIKAMTEMSDGVLVIIVGGFHAEYGGGLPDRLKARGVKNILVVTQYEASHGTIEDLQTKVSRHPDYGYISDYVWISGEPQP